jgi:hypothetical protein
MKSQNLLQTQNLNFKGVKQFIIQKVQDLIKSDLDYGVSTV